MSRDDGEVTDPTLKCASASKRVNFKGISVDFLNQYCSENDITSPTRFRKDLEDSIIRAVSELTLNSELTPIFGVERIRLGRASKG